jgi:hypothetical protein
MRKESIIFFILAILITLGSFGALSYFCYKNILSPVTSPAEAQATAKPLSPPASTPVKQPHANTQQQAKKASSLSA